MDNQTERTCTTNGEDIVFGAHHPMDSPDDRVHEVEEFFQYRYTFKDMTFCWMETLGFGVGVALNIVNRADNLVASYRPPYKSGATVVKVFSVKIPRHLYEDPLFQTPGTLQGPISGTYRISYVGNTSWQVSIASILDINGAAIAHCDFYNVTWNSNTKRPKPLPKNYKEKAANYFQRYGIRTRKPQWFPPPDHCRVVFAMACLTTEDCMDILGHPHYKAYIFKAFTCLSSVLEKGLLRFKESCDVSYVKVESFEIVYDQDCSIGDVLTYTLIKPQDHKVLYMVVSKLDTRICFVAIRFYDEIFYTKETKL